MLKEFYRRVITALESGEHGWIITVIAADGSTPQKAGAKMIVFADGSIFGTIGGGDVERLMIADTLRERPTELRVVKHALTEKSAASGGPKMACGGAMEFLVEPLTQGLPLYIIGGGHCAIELSALASKIGFAVTVIDNRSEWASPEKHPAARVVCAPYDKLAQHIAFSPQCFIVIMTHNHEYDDVAARLCLPHDYRFLGVIGSQNKARTMKQKLLTDGFPSEKIDQLSVPIGLPIGSHTPSEVAVSIAAQLISLRNQV
jgi:xanthine dehydrogenase accessory factor